MSITWDETHEGAAHDRTSQDLDLVTPAYEVDFFYHRDPKYRPGAVPKKPSPREEILALMAIHLNYAVVSSRVVFIFSLLIVMDFVLPQRANHVQIIGYSTSNGGTLQAALSDGTAVNISRKMSRTLKGNDLTMFRTSVFNVPWKAEDRNGNSAKFEISIYGNFLFAPLILLATAWIGVLYNKGVEFRYNLGVVNFILTLLNLAFLHIHAF